MGPLDTKGLSEALGCAVWVLVVGGVVLGLAIAFVTWLLITVLTHH